MSNFKIIRPKALDQRSGLMILGQNQEYDMKDFGFIGQYNTTSTKKFTGLVRHANDKYFYLFDSLTTNPVQTDTIDTSAASFSFASLKLGNLITSSDVNIGGNCNIINQALNVGTLSMSNSTITTTILNENINIIPTGTGRTLINADPTEPLGVATKQYIDNIINNFITKQPVRVVTIFSLTTLSSSNNNPGVYYNGVGIGKTITRSVNGSISLDAYIYDNVNLVLSNRVLVNSETNSANNGIYVVSDVGSANSPYVLTRAPDANTPINLKSTCFFFIQEGTLNADSGWVLSNPDPIIIDSTLLAFLQIVSGSATNIVNLGGEAINLYISKVGSNFQFRTIGFHNTPNMNTFNVLESNLYGPSNAAIEVNFDQSKIIGTGELVTGSINTGYGNITLDNLKTITAGTLSTGSNLQIQSSIIKFTSGQTLKFTDSTDTNYLNLNYDNELSAPTMNINAILTSTNTNGLTVYLKDNTTDSFTIKNSTQDILKVNSNNSGRCATKINSGLSYNISTIITDTILDSTYHIVMVDATNQNINITLPNMLNNQGIVYKIIKSDVSINIVTINVITNDNIDGIINSTLILKQQHDRIDLFATPISWYVC